MTKLLIHRYPMNTLLANRYQVIQELASGGFGKTFLAQDTHMPSKRYCVIKQLQPITDNNQVYAIVKDRFQREAAILEDLGNHTHQIPKLYAYFEAEGLFYLVQEYIQGNTLTKLVGQQGQLSSNVVQNLLIDLLSVLRYVHSKNIIHRDIKPDNIIVRETDNLPILIDFGAIRETMATVLSSTGSPTSSIVIGTPGFMPSEQSIGRPMYASDIYALGLTAIYLLTGKLPAQLSTDPMTGNVLWRQYAPNLSLPLADVLDKAIHTNPRDRFLTAQAMLEALQSGLPQSSPASNLTTVQPSQVSTPSQPPKTIAVVNPSTSGNKSNIFLKIAALGGILTLVAISAIGGGVYYYISQQKLEPEKEDTQLESQRPSSQNNDSEPIQDNRDNSSPSTNEQAVLYYEGSCGSPTSNNSIWYAVRGESEALDTIKNDYCGDAFIVQNTLQVASFNSEGEAQEFAQKLGALTGYNFWVEKKDRSVKPTPEPTETNQVEPSPLARETLDSSQAIAVIEQLYDLLSQKAFLQARQLYADRSLKEFKSSFFEKFDRITVEDLQVVSQTDSSIDLIGYNTYFYPDGSTQREKRSYVVQSIDGQLKVTDSQFIKVVKFR